MRRLPREELVLGRVLPGHLCDGAGRILVRAGQTLTEEHLRLLDLQVHGRVYVGPDWPTRQSDGHPPLSPQELLQALKRRHPPRGTGRGRRHARHEWRARLRIVVQECCKGMIHRRELTVNTCDLSAAGFAFVCPQFIHPGTVVYAFFDSLPTRPVMKGVIRNCAHLEGRTHRVGVEFVTLDPGENPR